MTFSKKLVAVLNKEIPTGVAMNALAHMTLGFGSSLSKEELRLNDYTDHDGHIYPNISQMPFIILRGKSREIRKLVHFAKEHHYPFGAFIHTMTGGTYIEQLNNTKMTKEEDLIYYGCVLMGSFDEVNAATKRLSLWKD